jgi:glycosyltransferase involved in cell wall biosynthesis
VHREVQVFRPLKTKPWVGAVIRLLEVLATLKRAGAETMVASLVGGLDRRQFEPAVVSLYDAFPDGLEAELEQAGVPVWHLGKLPGFDIRVYARLARVIREFQPDLVHTHSYVMRYTLPVWRGRAVHTVHNLARYEVDRIGRMIHSLGWRRGIVPVAVSNAVGSSFTELYGLAPAATIPNGIDLSRYALSDRLRDQWRAAHGFSDDALLVVSVGRLEPQKNPLLLARAFADAAIAEAHLLLAGDGRLRHELERCPNVHVLGVRTDIPQVLAAADLFALASDWEGFPIAIVEALAAGLPVVASAVGGVPEIVKDGTTGILVRARDAPAFAAALRALGRDAALRRTMSQAARQSSAAFGIAGMVARYSTLFGELGGRK